MDVSSSRARLRLSGVPSLQKIIVVDYALELWQMTLLAQCNSVTPSILEKENFPLEGSGLIYFESEIFFLGEISPEAAVPRLLGRGWQSGKAEHVLAFRSAYPSLQGRTPIIGCGNTKAASVLYEEDGELKFVAHHMKSQFHEDCAFLAIHQVAAE